MAFHSKLKPFPPGVSGNPGGRPKGRSITARLRELLEQTSINGQQIKDGKQIADLVAELVIKSTLMGDSRLLSILLDRTEGPVGQKVETAGSSDDVQGIREYLKPKRKAEAKPRSKPKRSGNKQGGKGR